MVILSTTVMPFYYKPRGPSALCRMISSFVPQNGRLGDADIERLKLTDSYINGAQVGILWAKQTDIARLLQSSNARVLRCLCHSTEWWTLHTEF